MTQTTCTPKTVVKITVFPKKANWKRASEVIYDWEKTSCNASRNWYYFSQPFFPWLCYLASGCGIYFLPQAASGHSLYQDEMCTAPAWANTFCCRL